jgi:hypothetical protein
MKSNVAKSCCNLIVLCLFALCNSLISLILIDMACAILFLGFVSLTFATSSSLLFQGV